MTPTADDRDDELDGLVEELRTLRPAPLPASLRQRLVRIPAEQIPAMPLRSVPRLRHVVRLTLAAAAAAAAIAIGAVFFRTAPKPAVKPAAPPVLPVAARQAVPTAAGPVFVDSVLLLEEDRGVRLVRGQPLRERRRVYLDTDEWQDAQKPVVIRRTRPREEVTFVELVTP
jgi:hypothetical protein